AVQGKKVLDVGCVDHNANQATREEWLHGIIHSSASEVIGLDFAEEEVRKLNDTGYTIIYGNAEEKDLGTVFDVVVAGEFIEHVENPGRFLVNMLKHLKPNGTIILTTPNPFYPKRMLEILIHGKALVNPQHVSWFCPQTLHTLMERTGYTDIEVIPFNNSEAWFGIGRLPSVFRDWYATNLLVRACRPNE
ncbi:partial putative S-adenosylmethionine-dependent methyltransferase/MSMEI_2290, partial [Methylococcales bacterium]